MNKSLEKNSKRKSPSTIWRLILLSTIAVVSIGLIFIASKINYAEIARLKTILKPFINEIFSVTNDQHKVQELVTAEESIFNAELANLRNEAMGSASFFLKAHDTLSDWGSKSGVRALIDLRIAENYRRWNHLAQAENFSRAELPDSSSAALRIGFINQLITILAFELKNPEERLALSEDNVREKQKCSHSLDISNLDPPGYFLTGAQFTKLLSGADQTQNREK
jgi:hypothetical protein